MTPDEHAYLRVAIDALADAVRAADGAARPHTFGDEWQQAAVQIVTQGATNVARRTGDGASRTVLLTRRLFVDCADAIADGCDAAGLRRGLDTAHKLLDERLQSLARLVSDPAALVAIAIAAARGGPAAVAERVAAIRQALAVTTSEYDRKQMQMRIAMLGEVAVVHPGPESVEKNGTRVAEDCLSALRAAHEYGVVPGGGRALADAAAVLRNLAGADDAEQRGINILCDGVLKFERLAPAGAPPDVLKFERLAPAGAPPDDLLRTVSLSLGTAVGVALTLLTNDAYLHEMARRERELP